MDLRGKSGDQINECMLDCYWNGGSPKVQSRFYDDFVIATERIGMLPANTYAAWRSASFGPDAGNDAISGPNADPESSGLTNLLRYAFALSAHGPVSAPATLGTVYTDGKRYLTVTFNHRVTATDLTYSVEASTDLLAWQAVALIGTDAPERVTTRDSVSMLDEPRRFLRIRVQATP